MKRGQGFLRFFAEPVPEKTPSLNRVWIWAFDTHAQRVSKASGFGNAFPVEGNRNTNEALAASAETSVQKRLPGGRE